MERKENMNPESIKSLKEFNKKQIKTKSNNSKRYAINISNENNNLSANKCIKRYKK